MKVMQKPNNTHIPYLISMQWVLLAGLIGFGIFMAWDSKIIPNMLANDNTRLSFLIIGLFLFASLHSFERSFFLSRQFNTLNATHTQTISSPIFDYIKASLDKEKEDIAILTEVLAERIRGQHQIGWFVVSALIKLGLLGTVIGFMLMLGSLDSVKSMDIEQVQTLMKTMTKGMKIALNTTLLGLGCSLLLGLQYLFLDRRADQLIAETINLTQSDFLTLSTAKKTS